jgi:hypothetical protein
VITKAAQAFQPAAAGIANQTRLGVKIMECGYCHQAKIIIKPT